MARSEYLTDPWDLWFYSASSCAGVVPDQNPIEAHHRAITATAANHLSASTGHVLASTLPRILVECAMDIGYDPIRHNTPGPDSSVMLLNAVNLCMDDNHYPTHRRKSQRTIAKIEKYYFNAEYYVVRDDNLNGLPVSAARTRLCQCSLRGNLRANEKVENIQLRYLSFHDVEIRDRTPYKHDWKSTSWSREAVQTILKKFRCNCKTFYQTGWLCEHVLACLHLVDSLDLAVMLRGLPARKPPGHPRKKTKCLVRDRVRRSQYSVEALVRKLAEKPASVINWSVLMVQTTTSEDGEWTERTYVAKIKPPFQQGGKRYWGVVYEDQDEASALEAEELARVMNYSFQLGHIIVP